MADQHISAQFYADLLGIQPALDVPGMTEFNLNEGCKLGIMPQHGIKRLLPGLDLGASENQVSRAEVYLIVPSAEEYFKRALCLGAKELSPVQLRDWGHLVGYCVDFDGHVVAFAALVDKS